MSRRRLLLAVLALVLGAGGVAFLVRFVQTSEQRALAGYELVDVYLVAADIPAGTPSAELGDRIVVDSVPAATRAEDAVVDLADLVDLVATVDLRPGEQLLNSRFDRPAEVRTVFGGTVEVPHGALEVTISASAERAIGAQIQPGDLVAVLVSFDDYAQEGDVDAGTSFTVDPATGEPVANPDFYTVHEPVSGLMLRKALVTNVQSEAETIFEQQDESGRSRSAPTVSLLITLAVNPDDASRLVFASEYGSVWLARDTELANEDAAPLATFESMFPDDGATGADSIAFADEDSGSDTDSDSADTDSDSADTDVSGGDADPGTGGGSSSGAANSGEDQP